MIYGLLWVAFVGFLLLIRSAQPRAQAAYGAMGGVALSVAAWACRVIGFEPGPTPSRLTFVALGLFALVTLLSLLTFVRTLMQSDETLKEWPSTVTISTLLILTFVFVVGGLGGSLGIAIGGAFVLFLISMVVGRSRRDRHP